MYCFFCLAGYKTNSASLIPVGMDGFSWLFFYSFLFPMLWEPKLFYDLILVRFARACNVNEGKYTYEINPVDEA